MAAPQFFFSIDLSGSAVPDDMLRELCAQLSRQTGVDAALVDALRGAITMGAQAGHHGCRLTVTAHDGRLDLAVSDGAGTPFWQRTQNI